MILTFQERFVEPIKAGTKIITIREDKSERWKPEMKIHFWKNSPRNPSKNPFQFALGIAYSVAKIMLNFKQDFIATKKGAINSPKNLDEIAIYDGFANYDEMKEFWNTDFFVGRCIVWDPKKMEVLK